MSILSAILPGKRQGSYGAGAIDRTTGVASRARLIDEISQVLKKSRRKRATSLLVLDVSDIRAEGANETDPLLPQLGRVLSSWIPVPYFLGRLRGREFGVVVNDGSAMAKVEDLAEKAISQIHHTPLPGSGQRSISTFVGISVSSRSDCSASELLQRADIAVSRARTSGRRHYVVVDRLPPN